MQVIIPGTFDLLHEGHKELIRFALLISKDIIITINGDKFSKLLGKKTSQTEQERLKGLKDFINCPVYIVNSESESLKIAIDNAPCFRLTGDDWDISKTSKRCGVDRSFWKRNNIYLIYKDRVPNISSTKLRNAQTKSNTVSI